MATFDRLLGENFYSNLATRPSSLDITVPVTAVVAQLLQPRWPGYHKPVAMLHIDATIGTDSTERVFNSYFGRLLVLLNLDSTVIATFFSTGM